MKYEFNEWFEKLPDNHKISLSYVLDKIKSFPGRIAIVGSSVSNKYPMGRDIDIVLLGLGSKDGKKFVRKLYVNFMNQFISDLKKLDANKNKLEYPLIIGVRHGLDDPEISEKQELIKGHGGSNIGLSIRSKFLNYDSSFFKEYMRESKEDSSGWTRTFMDIVVDFSFKDQGLDKNTKDWIVNMETNKNNFILLEKDFTYRRKA